MAVKGHRYLIEAVKMLRAKGLRVRLLLAGEGALRRPLEGIVRDMGLTDQVEFLGHLDHHHLLAHYAPGENAVDAVVLPSVDLGDGIQEGIPVALVEAMSYAIPVIATRTGGIPELLTAGSGILVEEADAGALAAAIETLATDPGKLRRVRRCGRMRVEASFDASLVARELARRMSQD